MAAIKNNVDSNKTIIVGKYYVDRTQKEMNVRKKMLIILLLFLPALFFNCSKRIDQQLPSVGDLLPDSAIYVNRVYYSPNYKDSIYLYKFISNGMLFYIEGDKNKIIVNILTGDTNFITPDGVRVGDNGYKVKEFCALRTGSSRLTEYELPSKWKALMASSDTFKVGDITCYGNNPEKMEVITLRKYK